MGFEELAAAIRREAAKEEDAVRGAAEEQVAAIHRETRERITRMETEAEKLRDQCSTVELALADSAQKIIARKKATAAEREYAEAVRERCRALFRDFMRSADYAPFVKDQFALAAAELGTVERVAADELTAAILRGAVNGLTVESTPGVHDGFAAYAKGGAATIWSTFDTRFDKAWRQKAAAYGTVIAEAARNGI